MGKIGAFFQNLVSFFFVPKNNNNASNPIFLYKRSITAVGLVTLLISVFFFLCGWKNGLIAELNFLLLAGASVSGGAAIGFLFGLPRSEKYRYIKPDGNGGSVERDIDYADNTNLEEVSDWLTKIIVGLSLVKFNTILFWIEKAAHNFQKVLEVVMCNKLAINAYLIGYCTIVFYFLFGCGVVYLWARVNLHQIFKESRLAKVEKEKEKLEAEKKILIGQTQEMANPRMEDVGFSSGTMNLGDTVVDQLSLESFKNQISTIYQQKASSIKDRSDLQKGRWGGLPIVNNKVLEASAESGQTFLNLTTVVLRVRHSDMSVPWNGWVAFFLHDSFPQQVVYAQANNGVAEYRIVAYESFVVGARTDDGVELELDLNKVPGFPPHFYYK